MVADFKLTLPERDLDTIIIIAQKETDILKKKI